MLDKNYTPKNFESRYRELWEEASAKDPQGDGVPYTIMMPPANVTGSLHVGHALTFTLQDILVRHFRHSGRKVLWQPGTDHAGIGTQIVLEKHLRQEGLSRESMGREAFLERAWAWKDACGSGIIDQLKALGASASWARERFTMDPSYSDAVRRTFVQLYEDGLLYRDNRLVNWDTTLQTAVSDLEVIAKEEAGSLFYIRYAIANAEGHITVATTRPETLFGDIAVAVHPEDKRYASYIGANVVLPLIGRSIPVIADTHSDPEKGSGAVKITPAHDFNDYVVGQRHGFRPISVIDSKGYMAGDNVPAAYRGLSVKEARDKLVAELNDLGHMAKIESITHTVPYSEKTQTVIEPLMTEQWFVKTEPLAKEAIDAVEEGKTTFFPKRWEKVYFEWMRNIEPWCVSRQIWWGHQIPAWYGPDKKVFVAISEKEAQQQALVYYGKNVPLTQDSDVLDTWFSSALYPFVTLEDGLDKEHYPTNVLVTGFDIIFFWVARMMMMGLYHKRAVPFNHVYIHSLIRDGSGQKMSKSKGNVINPLDIIETYGADALRFTLARLASPGKDIRLSNGAVKLARNFLTKLWNAARYSEFHGVRFSSKAPTATHPINQWILHEVYRLTMSVQESLSAYAFHEASYAVQRFVWNTFCDWYIELSKTLLRDNETADETRAVLSYILRETVRIVHPFAPFITEEIWSRFGGEGLLMSYVSPPTPHIFTEAKENIDFLITVLSDIRSTCTAMSLSASMDLKGVFYVPTEAHKSIIKRYQGYFTSMLPLCSIEFTDKPLRQGISIGVGEAVFGIDVPKETDLSAEYARLRKEKASIEKDVANAKNRLANKTFMEKAAASVIEDMQVRCRDGEARMHELEILLERMRFCV